MTLKLPLIILALKLLTLVKGNKMEAKFTKGEWWVNNIGKHHDNPNIDNLQICYSLEEECICDTVYELSDAQLIATAPDMYAMLESIAISMECFHGVDTSAIYELLAKARGETK